MIFSVRQLQEKRREQNISQYIDFVDLTKVFDLVSWDIVDDRMPSKSLNFKYFHTNTKENV